MRVKNSIKDGNCPAAAALLEIVNDNALVQNERKIGSPLPTGYELRELLYMAPH